MSYDDCRSKAKTKKKKTLFLSMSRYRQFHDENENRSSAILPEIELEEIDQVEYRIPVHSSRSRLRHCFSHRTRFEYILIISSIILFISLLIVLLRPERSTHCSSICLTSTCLDMSSSILASINRSVHPCDDFHQFVCGHWMRTHLIPKGHPSWSMMKILSEKNLIVLKSLLEQQIDRADDPVEKQVKRFYRSCMNLTELERLAIKPLEEHFQSQFNFTLQQWRDLPFNQTYEQIFYHLMKFFSIHYGISTIFPIDISADEKNSSAYTIHVSSIGSRCISLIIIINFVFVDRST